MNGHNTLDALRDISTKAKVSASVGIPILAGAMSDMVESIKTLGVNQETSKTERATMTGQIEKLSDDVQDLSKKIDGVNTCFQDMKKEIEKNPAIMIGKFIMNYKWLSGFLAIVALTIFTMWATFPGVREWTLIMLHVPKEIVIFLTQ